jgi:hypothetical protein
VFTESVPGVGPEATPEPASDADHAIVTSSLFQPSLFGAGDLAADTTGPVLSRTKEIWRSSLPEPEQPPPPPLALSVALTVPV